MNKFHVPDQKVNKVLDEFFVKDRGLTPEGAIRNSTLLSCQRDFLFLRGSKLKNPPYNLDKEQSTTLRNALPSFAAILVYCSAIDLLGRVMKKNVGNGASKKYFNWSATRWFELTRSQSSALWKLRCAMSHQYMIEKDQRAIPFGFKGSMKYDRNLKKWIF